MNKLIVLLLIVVSPVNAGIYTWTDKNGNVHFGDKPVDNESATEVKISINKKTGVTNSSGNKSEREYLLKKIDEEKLADAEKKKERVALNKKNKKLCYNYIRRYQNLIQSNKSYTMTPDGERTYQSDEQRATRKKQLSKSVAKYCR
jgi:hypothetical protein